MGPIPLHLLGQIVFLMFCLVNIDTKRKKKKKKHIPGGVITATTMKKKSAQPAVRCLDSTNTAGY